MENLTRRTALNAALMSAIFNVLPNTASSHSEMERRKMAEAERRTTSVDNPYIIANPVIGFVNLLGSAGNSLLEQDRKALAGVFENRVHVADRTLPRCNVLFLYCGLEPSGSVTGLSASFREVIKGAGAHVAVLAGELSPAMMQNKEFVKNLGVKSDWPANIVITLNRNGDHFGRFFAELFSKMRNGMSMPMAWVQLAPQGPNQSRDIPGTIALMEAGHIAFGPKRRG